MKLWPSSYTVNAVNRVKHLHPPIRAGLRGKATSECETKQSKFSHRWTHKQSWLETTTHPIKTAFRHGAVASNILWIPSQSPFMALKGSRITFKMLNRRDLSQLTAEVLSRDPMRHIKSPSTASAAAGPPPPTPPAVPKPLLERCIGRCPRLLVGRLGRRRAKDTSRPRARLFPLGCQVTPRLEEEHPTGCPHSGEEKWWPQGHESERSRVRYDLGTYSVFVTEECAAVYSPSRPAAVFIVALFLFHKTCACVPTLPFFFTPLFTVHL